MKDFRIGTRLVAGFAIVICMTFAFGAFAYIKTANQDPAAEQLAKVALPAAYLSEDLRSSVQKQYALFQQMLNATDRGQQERLETALKVERAQTADMLTRLDTLTANEKLPRSLATLKSSDDEFGAALDGALQVLRPGTDDARTEAQKADSETVWPDYQKYLAQTETLVAGSRSLVQDQRPANDGSRILLWLAGAILFCFALSSVIIRSITGPLVLATRVLEHASEGDLAYRAEISSNDELGQLLTGLNTQLENQSLAAGIIDRLAEGDLSVQINTLSEKDTLGRALLRLRNNLLTSVELAERLADGNLTAAKTSFSEKDRLGSTLIRVRDRMKDAVELAEKISEGNLAVEIKAQSEADTLTQALMRMRGNLQSGIQLAATLAVGDLSAEIATASEKDLLASSLGRLRNFLNASAQAVDKIAEGDLSVNVTPLSPHDVLGHSLVRMVGTLRQTIAEVVSSAENIGSVSGEVISSAEHVFSGSSQHSLAAAETSSVIGGLAISLRQSAGHSQQSEKLAMAAAEEGTLGGEAVSQTVVVMKEVAERIHLLDDIARKTDMLTLAAAVEAARAGEHGLGFGVVASELRKLVERTQTAASEIVRLTTGGVKTAECAGEFMARMVPGVRRTAELVREIASTTEEQNNDAVRAGKSIQMLDEVIHRNVSASQQMAATAEELMNRTKVLKSTVSFFKLDEEETAEKPLAALQKGAGS
jgi:methyl-accepting chemotaxis protein